MDPLRADARKPGAKELGLVLVFFAYLLLSYEVSKLRPRDWWIDMVKSIHELLPLDTIPDTVALIVYTLQWLIMLSLPIWLYFSNKRFGVLVVYLLAIIFARICGDLVVFQLRTGDG